MKVSPRNVKVVLEAATGSILLGLSLPAVIRAFGSLNWPVLAGLFFCTLILVYTRDRTRMRERLTAIWVRTNPWHSTAPPSSKADRGAS